MPPAFRHAACAAFYHHWADLRGGELAPHTREFLSRPPYALMRSTLILEVLPDGLLVRFMGTELVHLYQRDFTGRLFDQIVSPAWRDHLCADAKTVCGHPVGARLVTEATTNKSRAVECETVCLPLTVDPQQPPRCLQFRETGTQFKFDEVKVSFGWAHAPEWIDIGAGTP